MSDSIQDRVLKVIATTRRLPLDSVTPESTFEELGVDSLDRLNILFDLEGEFDIEIDDEEAKKVTSLHQMIDGVTQLVNAKASGAPPVTRPATVPAPVVATSPVVAPLPGAAPAMPAPVQPPAAPEPETPLDPAVLPSPLNDPSETQD